MRILPAFSMFQPTATRLIVQTGRAVGFCFDTPVLPTNVVAQSNFGIHRVKRRTIIPLQTNDHYVFSLDDTFAGDIVSDAYLNLQDWLDEAPAYLFSDKADGTVTMVVFETPEEMASYTPGMVSYPVYLAPRCEDLNVANARWKFKNIEYDCADVFVIAQNTGYWASFQIYEGADADDNEVSNRALLGALGFGDGALDNQEFFGGFLTLRNTVNIGVQVRETTSAGGTERFYICIRFHSVNINAGRVTGVSHLFGTHTVVASGTSTKILALPVTHSKDVINVYMRNDDGSNGLTGCYLKRYFIQPTGSQAEGTAIISSTAIAAQALVSGAAATPLQNLIISGTNAAGSDVVLYYGVVINHG